MLIEIDELRGVYARKVILVSLYFVAQFDEQRQRAVIHDRLMLETSLKGNPLNYHIDCILEIHHFETKAPNITIFSE
ncbi:MAG: hypothetical protein H7240_11810 [Glaciimonas sp.]|nr:hypothetical protein [Glaciimonas sp.]